MELTPWRVTSPIGSFQGAHYIEASSMEPHMRKKLVVLALACSGLTAQVQAQELWQSQMDLASAGAAASVILAEACSGATATATHNAAARLREIALTMVDPEGAYTYASDAFDMKVKALWQSTDGACTKMQRLVNMARSTGFMVPTR